MVSIQINPPYWVSRQLSADHRDASCRHEQLKTTILVTQEEAGRPAERADFLDLKNSCVLSSGCPRLKKRRNDLFDRPERVRCRIWGETGRHFILAVSVPTG